jgi:hypothetical protein
LGEIICKTNLLLINLLRFQAAQLRNNMLILFFMRLGRGA